MAEVMETETIERKFGPSPPHYRGSLVREVKFPAVQGVKVRPAAATQPCFSGIGKYAQFHFCGVSGHLGARFGPHGGAETACLRFALVLATKQEVADHPPPLTFLIPLTHS